MRALVRKTGETIIEPFPDWIDSETGYPLTEDNLGYKLVEDYQPPEISEETS